MQIQNSKIHISSLLSPILINITLKYDGDEFKK
jgi:hypothetical protein